MTKKKNDPFPEKGGVSEQLLGEIKNMIEEIRSTVAVTVNSSLTMLYWRIGSRINDQLLNNKRAKYGDDIVSTLSRQLVVEYGNGFSSKNLRHKSEKLWFRLCRC